MNQQIKISLGVIIIIIIALTAGIFIWQAEKNQSEISQPTNSQPKTLAPSQKTENPKMCTQEAKLCPDGSSVSRTGPTCEFAECSKVYDDTADWQTYRNNEYGFELNYPGGWFSYDESEKNREFNDTGINIFIQPNKEGLGDIPGPHANALSIGVFNHEGDLTAEDIRAYESNTSIRYGVEEMNIGGVKGYKITSICEGAGCGTPNWYVANNNRVYQFYSNLGYSDTFDQIISTFKFIK